jgi:glycosyltransferase involved in cell wall biosynthesis
MSELELYKEEIEEVDFNQPSTMLDIIIPYKNQAKYIVRCLSSITMQNLVSGCQVILIDDGSDEDQNIDGILKLYSNIVRIKYYKFKNSRGQSAARNIGLERGTSPYVIFLDADDALDSPFALNYLLAAITQKDENGIEKYDLINSLVSVQANKPDEPVNFTNTSYYGYLQGKIYRRSYLRHIDLWFNELSSYGENLQFTVLASILTDNVGNIDKSTFIVPSNNGESQIPFKNSEKFVEYELLASYFKSLNNIISKLITNKDFLVSKEVAENIESNCGLNDELVDEIIEIKKDELYRNPKFYNYVRMEVINGFLACKRLDFIYPTLEERNYITNFKEMVNTANVYLTDKFEEIFERAYNEYNDNIYDLSEHYVTFGDFYEEFKKLELTVYGKNDN